jgi:8-hydroxy-5-deazaflavin:NADPH oxidoreductase
MQSLHAKDQTMKIAVVGSGNVGKALGTGLAQAGHKVVFSARNIEHARAAAEAAGAECSDVGDAVKFAEVVIIAVPYATAGRDVAAEIAPHVAGKVVIDTTNPLAPDFGSLSTQGPSAAEDFAAWLPGAAVVKVFNTLFAGVQANPTAHGVELDALYATDDEAAGAKVAQLARDLGFRPVKVGPLARAHELEGMAFLNIKLQATTGGDWRTSYTMVGAPAAAVAAK